MGREDVTNENPMGFVPVGVIPDNADELLAASQKATEEAWIAAQGALDADPSKVPAKHLKALGEYPRGNDTAER